MATRGPSSSTSRWKYHVFLSFSGSDTRLGFTDHLYAALQRSGIITFRDSEELARGEDIGPNLLQAIEQSLFVIVILSPNYAFSTWCLDELQKILESRLTMGRVVFPVFYGVDPSDVRHQKGPFNVAFRKHEERFPKKKVREWRDALVRVGNLSGFDSKYWPEAELIGGIVQVVLRKLRPKLRSDNIDGLVGIGSRVQEMDSLLRIGDDDVLFLGIWGMGGIGMTTLARALYERIHNQFDIYCFLFNVREVSEKYGFIHLQRELLSYLKIRGIEIRDLYEGRMMIKHVLHNRKSLIVLDDVNGINQLENLVGKQDWFGPGSRILVTTRDMHVLESHRISKNYEIKVLNFNESLQLFCQKVFKRGQPDEDYLKLSKAIIRYTGGLPLAVNTLSVFFCGRTLSEWEDAFDGMKNFVHHDILNTLRIS